jgi:hypothetical protein
MLIYMEDYSKYNNNKAFCMDSFLLQIFLDIAWCDTQEINVCRPSLKSQIPRNHLYLVRNFCIKTKNNKRELKRCQNHELLFIQSEADIRKVSHL